jgi:hypothetical protein
MNVAKVKANQGWTMRPYNVLNSFSCRVLRSVSVGGKLIVEQQKMNRMFLRV